MDDRRGYEVENERRRLARQAAQLAPLLADLLAPPRAPEPSISRPGSRVTSPAEILTTCAKLRKRLERDPTVPELAEALGCRPRTLRNYLRSMRKRGEWPPPPRDE